MFCPACVRTTDQLLRSDCPLCHGDGFLKLGTAVVALYGNRVAAEAVRLSLEVIARSIITTTTLSDDRKALLVERSRVLVEAGLLAPSTTTPPAGGTPAGICETVTGYQPTLFDMRVADTALEPYVYGERDRPRARGLPVLSASGHPSAVQMITDPCDPFGSTMDDVKEQARVVRKARIIADVAGDVAKRKQRRRVKKAGKQNGS